MKLRQLGILVLSAFVLTACGGVPEKVGKVAETDCEIGGIVWDNDEDPDREIDLDGDCEGDVELEDKDSDKKKAEKAVKKPTKVKKPATTKTTKKTPAIKTKTSSTKKKK